MDGSWWNIGKAIAGHLLGDEESSQMIKDGSWWNIAKAVGQHFLGDDGKFDQEKFNQFMNDGSWWNTITHAVSSFLGDEESSQMRNDASIAAPIFRRLRKTRG